MKDLSESRVLVVDDTEANIDVLVQTLRGEYRLSVAIDGESALEMLRRHYPAAKRIGRATDGPRRIL